MRQSGLTILSSCAAIFAACAAQAQYFTFTTDFETKPVLSSVAGNQINVTDSSNLSGLFAGALGTDIQLSNFIVNANSAATGTFNTNVTESLTLTPSDSNGVALPGDTPVTHSFTLNYSGALNSSSTSTTMVVIPSAPQLYLFADGSVFSFFINSYSGPGGSGSSGQGALGGHVNGALAGVPQGVPEPGSWAILVGISASIGMLRLRKRTSVVSQA